ncbi:xanthine dehydrogenase family protein molybdopterin-binding subunit [Moorella naiadis]|uniref:xanthine dehydrogenase family protein molybdopterin-binding subunit n=1 Tax=Moorella naiadis (nom. illeg.) TaxID=3093670 RepID=UPI003D9C8F95
MANFIGNAIAKVDAWEKVTGQLKYPSDIFFPDMLYLQLVRATIPHGLIKEIDTSAAQSIEGVKIFTAADVPVNSFGSMIKDQPVFASERVRFYGEPVAMVAAPDPRVAARAAKMVRITYEPLPAVATVVDALQPDAPAIHPGGNLLHELHIKRDDVTKAFNRADLVLENTFTLPVIDHLCLETEGGVAYWDKEILTIKAGTQNPFYDRSEIARVLKLPEERIRVCCPCTGGGFGGKDGNTVQLFLALATWKTGKPCRLVFSRQESLMATYKRHGAQVWARIGFTSDGRITAYQARLDYDTGAYAALGPAVLGLATEHCPGPYRIPAVQIDAYLAYTNKPPASAMRGFGEPQAAMATETLLNQAAARLKIDPITLRLRNALQTGEKAPLGHMMHHSIGLKQALEQLRQMPLWQEQGRNQNPQVAYGMAVGHLSCGMGKGIPDQAEVEITRQENGKYLVKAGVVDIGQGNRTAFAQIAATALGVPMEQVEVVMADTTLTRNCGSTAASRTTYIVGSAILEAVADLQRNQQQAAGPPRGYGRVVFPEVQDANPGPGLPHIMYSFIAQAVKVRLDPVSGNLKLEAIDAVTEAGKILNPLILAGQIEGGMAMAAGYALWEEMVFQKGIPRTLDLATYLLPTALDLPDMYPCTVDMEEWSGPYGLKGCAEVGSIALAPAIAGAVMAMLDWMPVALPLSREQLKQAWQRKRGDTALAG